MNCIIVDDEPLARRAIELLIKETAEVELTGIFNNAAAAGEFISENKVDLIFLDIQMPEVTGMEFARTLPPETLVIFTTAYTQYAIESYDIDAIDYLVKPVELPRFKKAVDKAVAYHTLIAGEKKDDIEVMAEEYLFIKSDRKYYKVEYENILFIEGLKDYSIIQCQQQRIITHINLKNMSEELPEKDFFRISKSYIVNTKHIHSFDNNSIFIKQHEIMIGNTYREAFFDSFLRKKKKK